MISGSLLIFEFFHENNSCNKKNIKNNFDFKFCVDYASIFFISGISNFT